MFYLLAGFGQGRLRRLHLRSEFFDAAVEVLAGGIVLLLQGRVLLLEFHPLAFGLVEFGADRLRLAGESFDLFQQFLLALTELLLAAGEVLLGLL